MSGFTDRSLNRAFGVSGRIQPRIAPITAPDPYSMSDSPSSLEIIEELEARSEFGGSRDLRAGGSVLEDQARMGDAGAVSAEHADLRPSAGQAIGIAESNLLRSRSVSARERGGRIVAPDAYVMSSSPSSLEIIEELEARSEFGGSRDLRAGGSVLENQARMGDAGAVSHADLRPSAGQAIGIAESNLARSGQSRRLLKVSRSAGARDFGGRFVGPDPYLISSSHASLEIIEELEAPSEFGGSRDLRAGGSDLEEQPGIGDADPGLEESTTLAEPETLPSSERSSKAHAPEVPSFRARGFSPLRTYARTPPATSGHPSSERAMAIAGTSVTPRGPDARRMALAPWHEVSSGETQDQSTSQLAEALVHRMPPSDRAAGPGASTAASEPFVPVALDIASMGVGRRSAAAPVVRVEIGKVEVRAAQPPREPARPVGGIAKPATFVSLQQYLDKRGTP